MGFRSPKLQMLTYFDIFDRFPAFGGFTPKFSDKVKLWIAADAHFGRRIEGRRSHVDPAWLVSILFKDPTLHNTSCFTHLYMCNI